MNSLTSVRSLRAKAALLLASALASCSRGPELAAAAPSTASAPVRASALAPVPPPARQEAVASAPPAQTASQPASPPTRPAPAIAAATAGPGATPVPATAPAPGPAATYLQAGRVLDESGQPLIGATVLLRGTNRGTSTDASGSYMLEVPKGENTFLIGYAGYEDETASSHDGQPLTVTLLPAPGASPSPPPKGRRGPH